MVASILATASIGSCTPFRASSATALYLQIRATRCHLQMCHTAEVRTRKLPYGLGVKHAMQRSGGVVAAIRAIAALIVAAGLVVDRLQQP